MSLKNKHIVITSGPTWVPIDDVRVISNESSGEMGRLMAQRLIKAGARVTLIEGPVLQAQPLAGCRTVKYTYFDELVALLNKHLNSRVDGVIHAAAVADYMPEKPKKRKMSSDLKRVTLTLVKTPKVINTIKEKAANAVLVGFKLQSSMSKKDAVTTTRKLFEDAGCDMVVANAKMRSSYKAFLVGPDGVMSPALDTKRKVVTQLIKQLESKLK